jgi:hypothetical protein
MAVQSWRVVQGHRAIRRNAAVTRDTSSPEIEDGLWSLIVAGQGAVRFDGVVESLLLSEGRAPTPQSA